MESEAAASTSEYVAEQAWQLSQKFAHEDYVGEEPDLFQLRRDLIGLAMLVHQLAGGDHAEG